MGWIRCLDTCGTEREGPGLKASLFLLSPRGLNPPAPSDVAELRD